MGLSLSRKFPIICAALLSLTCSALADVSSVPVGYLRVKLAAGAPGAPVVTSFSVPLTDEPANEGVTSGRIAGLGADWIKVASAGWVAGELALKKAPYAVRLKTGAKAGLTLTVLGNTTNTLTVETSDDLTKMGILKGASGDLVQLIPIDTLDSLFGDDTLIGAKKIGNADVVYLGAHRQTGYFYNTSLQCWTTDGSTKDRGRTRILPDAAVSIARVGPATTLYFDGRVPETAFVVDVANSGDTYTHTGFPVATTLGELALQKKIKGWVAAKTPAKADQIAVAAGASWVSYYYTGTMWRRTSGSTASRDDTVIKAGVPIRITRVGSASGSTPLVVRRPYRVN